MKNFQRNPESSWPRKRLKYVATFPGKREVAAIRSDVEVSFVPMDAVGENGGMRLDVVKPLGEVLNGFTYFRDNDVVIAKITPCFENGKGALASGLHNGIAFGTTELHVVRAGTSLIPEFLFYTTISSHFRKLGEAEMYGAGGQKRIPEHFIRDYRQPVPSIEVQRAVVRFLDKKTAQIDALIAKKVRLIELLKKKLQAIMTRAVTKGLHPEAEMKSSGIDWLGMIPSHWEIVPIGYVSRSHGGSTPSKENQGYWNGDIPWVSPKDMKVNVIEDSIDHVTENALSETSLKLIDPPVVLIVVRGMILAHSFPVGVTARSVTINQDMKAIRPVNRVRSDFLSWLLRSISPTFFAIVEESGHGTRVLRTDLWSKQKIFVPPLGEQQEIVDHLERTSESISVLIDKVSLAISRLKSLRIALITAAVTGQIDVTKYRGEAPCQ